jgi:hypothetical protein
MAQLVAENSFMSISEKDLRTTELSFKEPYPTTKFSFCSASLIRISAPAPYQKEAFAPID